MKIIFSLILFFYSLNIFANDSIQRLKNDPDFDGTVISFCTLNKKECGKIDRSRPDLSVSHALKLFQQSADAIEKITPNFEYLNLVYKTADQTIEKSSLKFSYTRAKTPK